MVMKTLLKRISKIINKISVMLYKEIKKLREKKCQAERSDANQAKNNALKTHLNQYINEFSEII